jgi:acetyl/propionyl-CoA carboxylase alpha subunit
VAAALTQFSAAGAHPWGAPGRGAKKRRPLQPVGASSAFRPEMNDEIPLPGRRQRSIPSTWSARARNTSLRSTARFTTCRSWVSRKARSPCCLAADLKHSTTPPTKGRSGFRWAAAPMCSKSPLPEAGAARRSRAAEGRCALPCRPRCAPCMSPKGRASQKGDTLLLLEAMKMEIRVQAPTLAGCARCWSNPGRPSPVTRSW